MKRAKALLEAALLRAVTTAPLYDYPTTTRVPLYDEPHLCEPTTNTRCARCNRPREEH